MNTAVTTQEKSLPGPIGLKRAFGEILVATDFSARSDRAVSYAVDLARRLGSHVTLLHVVPTPYPIDYTLGGIPNGEWEHVRQRADQKLAAVLQRAKIRYDSVDTLVRVGSDLHKEIVGAAREVYADLVVVSTHGYKGWKLLLFGSDADELLIKIPCPVLVVH